MKLILFSCPCGKNLRADASFAGKQLRCPQCKTIIIVPVPPVEAKLISPPDPFQFEPESEHLPESAPPEALPTRTSTCAVVFTVLSGVTFLFLSVLAAVNIGQWGQFDWARWFLSSSWCALFFVTPLVCFGILIVVVFWGHRLKRKAMKLRATGAWLFMASLAAVYAFAPGWYKQAGRGWVTTGVATSKTGLEYLYVIAFEPIFRMSPLIFLGLGTLLGVIAICFPRKSVSDTFVWDQLQTGGSRGSRTGIEVNAKYWFLAPFMYFCRPVIVIDGKACKKAWRGRYFFGLEPGRHTLEVFRRFLFVRRCGYNQTDIVIREGEIVQVQYSVVGVFSRGAFQSRQTERTTPVSNAGLWGRATLNGLGAIITLLILVMGFGLITTQSRDRALADAGAQVAGVGLILWVLFALSAIPLDYFRLKFSHDDRTWRPERRAAPGGLQSFGVLANFVLCIALIVGLLLGPVFVVQSMRRPGAGGRDARQAPRVSADVPKKNNSGSSQGVGVDEPIAPLQNIPKKLQSTQVTKSKLPAMLIGERDHIVTGRVSGGGFPRTFTVQAPKDHSIFVIGIDPKIVPGLQTESEDDLKAYQKNGGLLASLNAQLGYRKGQTCVLAHDGQFQVEDNKLEKHPCLLVLHEDAFTNRVSGNIGGRQLFGATASGKNALQPFLVFVILPTPRYPDSLIGLPGIDVVRLHE